ncbi:hypothetical protein MRB53_026184 [Persea americana]|uniref:Uncharacterized protein n=1 Tax=Persea americana TaxID=3435 RepID=A0ACC2LIA0_PERAE|nr:hypothetical protein MRB53_026184 [Persea americana]
MLEKAMLGDVARHGVGDNGCAAVGRTRMSRCKADDGGGDFGFMVSGNRKEAQLGSRVKGWRQERGFSRFDSGVGLGYGRCGWEGANGTGMMGNQGEVWLRE